MFLVLTFHSTSHHIQLQSSPAPTRSDQRKHILLLSPFSTLKRTPPLWHQGALLHSHHPLHVIWQSPVQPLVLSPLPIQVHDPDEGVILLHFLQSRVLLVVFTMWSSPHWRKQIRIGWWLCKPSVFSLQEFSWASGWGSGIEREKERKKEQILLPTQRSKMKTATQDKYWQCLVHCKAHWMGFK